MAFTYKIKLHNGNAYQNLADGVTARIRIKKLDGIYGIKSIYHDMPISELNSISQSDLQVVIDTLIAVDVQLDADAVTESEVVVPDIKSSINTKIKKMKTDK